MASRLLRLHLQPDDGNDKKTTKLNWTFIRGKKLSVIAASIPTVIAFGMLLTVLVVVSVVLTSAGCASSVMRRESRRKKAVSDRYMLPESYV
jgi:hypothetical protein